MEELSEIEMDTVLRLDPSKEELMLMYRAKRNGIDVKTILEVIINGHTRGDVVRNELIEKLSKAKTEREKISSL